MLFRKLAALVLLSLFLLWNLPGLALAVGGDLDLSFGTGGKVITDFAGGPDTGAAVAVQADNKIIVAGSADALFGLVRYNPNGSLDASFGTAGKVTTEFSGGFSAANDVLIQPDGKIVAVGVSASHIALARYNTDGTLDLTFGDSNSGKRITNLGSIESANAVALQSDGKLVVAGSFFGSNLNEFVVLRYDANGTLDPGFGTAGVTSVDMGGDDFANDVLITASGNIVAAGTSGGDFALLGLDTGGILDATFGTAGKTISDFGSAADRAFSIGAQSDGKLVVGGHTTLASPVRTDFCLARYTATGILDPTFGTNGHVTTNFFDRSSESYDLVVQGNDRVILVGKTFNADGDEDFAVARYTSGGGLDNTFGVLGKVTTDFGGTNDRAIGAALQADGKILAAGFNAAHNNLPPPDFVVARYVDVVLSDTIGVYRPSNQTFYLRNSNTAGLADIQIPYGAANDLPVVGDWDGNGTTTIGVYRPSENFFYLRNSNTQGPADLVIPYGAAGDIPIVGDWDGDGDVTIGVYRPSNQTFYLRNSNLAGVADLVIPYGAAGDIPLAGDWDSNGTWTIGVYRTSESTFYLRNSNTAGAADIVVPYGTPNLDIPVVGDWDGNGSMTIGVYRSSVATFFLRDSNTVGIATLQIPYGTSEDKPLAGDWDSQP